MRYAIARTERASRMVNTFCGVVFVLFSLTYLIGFQQDYLSLVQHYYSDGRNVTHGHALPLLATAGLTLMGVLLHALIHLPIRMRALSWLPPCAFMALLCSIPVGPFTMGQGGAHWVSCGIFLLLSFGAMYVAYYLHESRSENASFFMLAAPNVLILLVGFLFVVRSNNTQRTLHIDLRVERAVGEGRYEDALRMVERERRVTPYQSALCAFVLQGNHQLGDRFFRYATPQGSNALLPANVDSLRPWNLTAQVRACLGGFPGTDLNATRFLDYLAQDSVVRPAVHEYRMVSYLLDRNFPAFSQLLLQHYAPQDTLGHVYVAADSLPRNYAEALLLYTRQEEHPIVSLSEALLEARLDSFQNLRSKVMNPADKAVLVRRQFADTYWYYYYTK